MSRSQKHTGSKAPAVETAASSALGAGRWRRWCWGGAVTVVVLAGLAMVGEFWLRSGRKSGPPPSPYRLDGVEQHLPKLGGYNGYVGSGACLECHPKEHATWARSYHRTMTQPAVGSAVLGKFDGTTVRYEGAEYRVYKEGEAYWAEMPDPDVMMYTVQGGRKLEIEKVPRVRRPVVMATGSHHYQTYWVASSRHERLLQTLPLVYLREDQRWIPREEAFIRGPQDTERFVTQWNHHCIRCHSTAGNPGLEERTGQLKTQVAELGISCEACHGPGEAHVKKQQPSLSQLLTKLTSKHDASIVNPSALDHRRSSEICGQCHGAYILREEFAMQFAKEGPLYRPGEELERTRYLVQHPSRDPTPQRVADFRRNPQFFREQWWDDGTILAAGREFTALSASKCYTQGTISCVSCHSMHRSDPNDQLKAGRDGPEACVQCHSSPKYTTELQQHTHHLAQSDGSNCLNCHMPHTSYALFTAIRSHQIESPSIARSARYGTPNACNLCHLDKTLAWAQESLSRWYGTSAVPLSEEQQTVAAGVLWLTKGHAAQRAIAAWHTGWAPAQKAAGKDWMAPFQSQLLNDPYGVVRYIGARSLKTLPGYADFEYDFLSGAADRAGRSRAAFDVWFSQALRSGVKRTNAEVLMDQEGRLRGERLQELIRGRDNRSVTIQE